jgi:hypothetical protein
LVALKTVKMMEKSVTAQSTVDHGLIRTKLKELRGHSAALEKYIKEAEQALGPASAALPTMTTTHRVPIGS